MLSEKNGGNMVININAENKRIEMTIVVRLVIRHRCSLAFDCHLFAYQVLCVMTGRGVRY